MKSQNMNFEVESTFKFKYNFNKSIKLSYFTNETLEYFKSRCNFGYLFNYMQLQNILKQKAHLSTIINLINQLS